MTTVSVIIPTYNRCAYLLECLRSVAEQRRVPEEVIVVDDGSNDGTREAIAAIKGVKLVVQMNAGPGAARNRGAAAASSEYIAFLDSDDIWFPWSLEAMMALIAGHGNPSLLFACFKDFSGASRTPPSAAPEGCLYADFLAAAPDGVFAGAGMIVVKRSVFNAAGGFAEDRLNAEDHDLALRLGTAPGFLRVTQPIIVGHRIHSGNEMGDAGATLGGLARLVANERAGSYPGGAARLTERRTVIARHARWGVIAAVRAGAAHAAMPLYLDTFLWNARSGGAAYLAAAPLLSLTHMALGTLSLGTAGRRD
jgi:hypothetical protein